MTKRDFFLKACQAEAYRHKRWVLTAFSQIRNKDVTTIPYLLVAGDTHYSFHDPDNEGELTVLPDCPVGEPPFRFRDKLKLKAGELPNLDRDVETTYGNVLFNFLVLVGPFGDKIKYVEGRVDLTKIEAEIEQRLTSDGDQPRDGVDVPIFVSEYKNYVNAALSLVGYTQLCVASATPKTMTRDPRIPEIRAALLEKYKDSLDDPATIAKIDAELIKVDKEWMKGDPGEGFYIKGKSFKVVRKKAHLMHGAETGFQDGPKVTTITNSLSEGWDVSKLPAMANSLREGSYNRGAMTALGGESAKTLTRIFQNARVAEDDCGTSLGWKVAITQANHQRYLGFFRVIPSGSEELSENNIAKFIDKTIVIRSPMFCKTPKTGFCVKCMGRQNSQNPNALGSLVSQVGSVFMDKMMGKMHGTELATAEYQPELAIT